VLEGNRRVAALKALLSPASIPSFAGQIRGIIGDRDFESLRSIETLVAPSRAEAEPVLAAIHTVTSRRPWGTLRKAAFYYAQIEAGASVDDLRARYQNDEITSMIRVAEMMRAVQSVPFKDVDVLAYVQRRDFPITTLERLYESTAFREKAQMSFDSSGRLQIAADADQFKSLLARVVTDMSSGDLNSRVANKPEAYIDGLPQLGRTSERAISDDGEFQPSTSFTSAPKRPSPSISDDPLECTLPYPAVRRMVTELLQIPYRKYPNATHDLLRSVLECSLRAFFDETGTSIEGSGRLSDVLKSAQSYFTKDKRLLPIVRQIQSGGPNQYMNSLAFLNAVNHNPDLSSAAETVKAAYDTMYPLLRYVLDSKNVPA